MPLNAMADIGAKNLGAGFRITSTVPTGKELLETIGTYIPTDVATLYIAVAGGIATMTPAPTNDDKQKVAVFFAVVCAFATWVLIHRKAQKENPDPKPKPDPLQSLKGGWYEVLAAPVAFFVWALAMPDSWFDWGALAAFGPVAAVGVTTLVIGGLAVLLNRNRE
ncbi:MAG: hypothetical protein ACRDF9_11385 [Candidatus Limnocylindria bacterium]